MNEHENQFSETQPNSAHFRQRQFVSDESAQRARQPSGNRTHEWDKITMSVVALVTSEEESESPM
jgi:hypothetical protein